MKMSPWIPILLLCSYSMCTSWAATTHFLQRIRNLQGSREDPLMMGFNGYKEPTSKTGHYPSSSSSMNITDEEEVSPQRILSTYVPQLNEKKQQRKQPPFKFLEVSAPTITPHDKKPCASLHIFHYSFGNTYSPATAKYIPPSSSSSSSSGSCHKPKKWSKIILTWKGSSVGRQFDRIAGVWIGGVEFLRTCTAEPSKNGSIYWSVQKDVTKYASILAKTQPLAVELGNVIDNVYTGVFHIDITLDFYSVSHTRNEHDNRAHPITVPPADLILPLSQTSPFPAGHWFQISNDSYVPQVSFSTPRNVYKAVLEIYVSFHENDEFWYTNPPNEYIERNNLSDTPGNGPFREVQAFLDGKLVAAIWPYPVVYTGGIINLYWRPVVGIGAFDLPTYEFDVSPFIGNLIDGKEHSVGIRVENGQDLWLIDGCLHLWLDHNSLKTSGKLLQYIAPPYATHTTSDFEGLNGTFHTRANRSFSYSGYVVSSMGNFTLSSSHSLKYQNVLVFEDNTETQGVSQKIESKGEIKKETPSHVVLLQEDSYTFPLDLSCLMLEGPNLSSILNCNFSHGLNAKKLLVSESESGLSFVKNNQRGEGEITISNNIAVAGVAGLHQHYSSKDTNGCYKRLLSTKNSTILKDSTNFSCASIKM